MALRTKFDLKSICSILMSGVDFTKSFIFFIGVNYVHDYDHSSLSVNSENW